MKEEINRALNRIFAGYEETPALAEFKEEIAANLAERIADLRASGLAENQALAQALAELGDITEAADAVSRQKRQEIISQAYGKKPQLDLAHAIGYPICGVVLLFGIIVATIAATSAGTMQALLGSLLPFITAAAGGFTYLGLTQETRSHFAMGWKRALLYTLAALLLMFGACASGITLFANLPLSEITAQGLLSTKLSLLAANSTASLGTLLVFVLPSLALLAFLIITEKERKKPWLQQLQLHQTQESLQPQAQLFGLLCGALWIFALALFLLLGLVVSWRISWLVFPFAIAAQLLLQYFFLRKSHNRINSFF